MAQAANPDVPLSDSYLLEHADDPDVAPYFSSAERRRLTRLKAEAQPEGPTSRGFLQNVAKSGARMAGGIAQTVGNAALTIAGQPNPLLDSMVSMASRPGETASAVGSAIKDRYGSVDALLGTLYNDPVGVASDVSLGAGGLGVAAKAAKLPRIAAAMEGVGTVMNPLSIPAQATTAAGESVYKAAVNPSRRIQRGFPGAVDEGMKRNILPTRRGLERTEDAIEASSANTHTLLQEADAAGAQGVNVRADVIGSLGEPARRARTRFALGKPDERGDISARAKALARRNPNEIPLVEANKLKQEAQRLADSAFRAEERGAVIKDLEALSDRRVAQAYRKAIEVKADAVGVSGVAQSNQQTQALLGLAQALEDATQMPSRLTNLIGAATAAGAGATGGLGAGVVAGGLSKALTSRPVLAGAGIAGKKLVGPALTKAQLLRALTFINGLEREPEQ